MSDVHVPPHWLRGQLLDLRRYSNGTYICTLLGEEAKPDQSNVLTFESSFDAQQFTSAWYAPAKGRVPT